MKLQKIRFLVLFLSIILFSACKKNIIENNKTSILSIKKEVQNFDDILKCTDYSYSNNYFITADYGCIYYPNGQNNFGNLIIYLIPKNKQVLKENNIEQETKIVNSLNSKQLKEKFYIYIFLIPKEFLNNNPNGDPIYYQKEKYKEEFYTYDNKIKQWSLVDSISIENNSQNSKEQNWRDSIINSKNTLEQSSYKIPNNFYIHDSALIELKTKSYKILALEKIENRNDKGDWHFELPIIILEKKDNDYSEILNNVNLLFKFNNNCPANGYEGITVKNNYFTIEQSSCSDFMFVNSYTTFKIDETSGEIYLHKYGEEYTDRSDPDKKIPNKVWSIKDFGDIKFENVTNDFILKLKQK